MGKYDLETPTTPDIDLIELLARKGMGWEVHSTSGHRPGSRDIPHAWRWNHSEGPRVMVYCGGSKNERFDPLGDETDAQELLAAFAAKGIDLDGWDLTTDDGRRKFCEAAAERAANLPDPEPKRQEIPGSPATFTIED